MSHFNRPIKEDVDLVVAILPNSRTELHKIGCAHAKKAVREATPFDRENSHLYEDWYNVAPCAAAGKANKIICEQGSCIVCA